jgi:branched-chain amino acid aminotransferase group I
MPHPPVDPAALPDPRNASLIVWVDGELLPREQARVSVFDSVVQGGDAVWEGLRVYDGGIFRLAAHLQRLERSARALAFERVPPVDEIVAAIRATLAANGMRDGAHIRLTLTRGPKLTSGMSPHWNTAGPTLIVLAEWKPPVFDPAGIRLVTSSVRRNPPQCLDSRIHHNNLLNNILAKIEANRAGVDDAVMLDVEGYVAETNATNLFVVGSGGLATPTADHCLPGITRGVVLEIAAERGLDCRERRVSLSELHSADEVFSTGTMGELTPVVEIDGRALGDGGRGPLTRRLQGWFAEKVAAEREDLGL